MRRLKQIIKNWIPFPTKGDLAVHYQQVENLVGVYNLLNHGYSLGSLRGWAISPDSLNHILKVIASIERPLVIEFGSGQSTIAISKLLKVISGRLISVEHDANYYQRVHKMLETFGFEDVVSSIISPLRQQSPELTTYNMDLLPDISPHVVIVDGPPGKGASRFPPLNWAYEHLADNGVIFLDDYTRDDERQCVRNLVEKFPAAIVEELEVEKGLAIIRKPKMD